MWRWADNLHTLVLSSYQVNPEDPVQVLMLSIKCLKLLNHLAHKVVPRRYIVCAIPFIWKSCSWNNCVNFQLRVDTDTKDWEKDEINSGQVVWKFYRSFIGPLPFGHRHCLLGMAVSVDGSSCPHYILATWFTCLPVKPLSELLSSVLFGVGVDYYLYPNDKIIAGSMFAKK